MIRLNMIGLNVGKIDLATPLPPPRQLMRTYVQELDFLVVALDEEMDWSVWDDYTTDTYPDDASE
jgi:hypothetical protein